MFGAIFLTLISCSVMDASKILFYVGNLPMGSHVRVSNFLAASLCRHGHDVWFLIPDAFYERRIKEDKNKIFSYLTIPVNFTADEVDRINNDFLEKSMNGETSSVLDSVKVLMSKAPQQKQQRKFKHVLEIMIHTCDVLLGNDDLIRTIQNKKFDFFIGDSLMPCNHIISKRLSVTYATLDVPPVLPAFLSNLRIPSNPAYVPEGFSHLTDQMSFFQRLFNFLMSLFVPVAMDSFLHTPIHALEKKHNVRSNRQHLFSDVDIWLGVNCHPAFEFPRPITPDILCTRGMLSTEPKPILNKEMSSFLQSSNQGVILVSMGSLVNISSVHILEKFAAAFSRLPYNIIWKHNSKTPPKTLRNNTRLMSWIPQNDLLGHPNVKSMMYHGGINGVYQAVYHGKPVIGLPMYQDQHDNLARLKARGMAETIDCNTITSEIIYQTIMKIMSNASYKQNADFRSNIIQDTIYTPDEEVTKWIEHLIKFGSHHLHPAARSLSLFEHYLIDVISILSCLCLFSLLTIYIGFKLLTRMIISTIRLIIKLVEA